MNREKKKPSRKEKIEELLNKNFKDTEVTCFLTEWGYIKNREAGLP